MTSKRYTRAPRQKFTAEQEAEICYLWTDTALPAEEIAPRFGLTPDQLIWMARRRAWNRACATNGKSNVFSVQERLFAASLARDRRMNMEDNPRGETRNYPVPVGGFKIGR